MNVKDHALTLRILTKKSKRKTYASRDNLECRERERRRDWEREKEKEQSRKLR